MSLRHTLTTVVGACRRALHLLARPAKGAGGRGGLVVQPYRGYGSEAEVFLMGRVFRQGGMGARLREGTWRRDLLDVARRLLRRGVGGAVLVARFGGTEHRVTTDRDGYFRVHLHPRQPPPAARLWHPMDLELLSPPGAGGTGALFVPPPTARYVVISDIDDTVMETGVANKVVMLWRLFAQGARSRVAFPGVAALYKALHGGVSGGEWNPLLYVSRGPWSLYEVLDEFFHLHGIPVGPILFLREWGLTLSRPLPRRAKDHKLALIRHMLALYRDRPFILIGDSGQRDPEVYARAVREHPGRVLAIYIRNVSRRPARPRAIEALAREVVGAGSSLLLAADSFAMAAHAAERGLIAAEALAEVLAERMAQQGAPALQPTLTVRRPTPEDTRAAVEQGAVDAALEGETGTAAPPNVVVEPASEQEPAAGGRGQAAPG
jgi:phosphatidate phosphatase APP1